MTKKISFLPEYTLSQLTDRVALKLDYFNKLFNSDNLFEGIGEPCLMVESEPRSISTVILEAKKDNKIMFNVSNLAKYNFKLTLIYIILYYRHRDDALYQTLVFPDLRKDMGFYGKEEILKQKINQKIDKILELDKLIEQSKEKKDVPPLISFTGFNRAMADKSFDDYCVEKLFLNIKDIIEKLDKKYCTHLDVAEIWYNGKQVVHALQKVRYPELYIQRVVTSLVYGQYSNEYAGAQIIVICAYFMIRSKANDHFTNFIRKMEDLASEETDLNVIHDNISSIREWLDNNQPYDDYNYFDEQIGKDELYSRAEIEKLQKQIEAGFADKINDITTSKNHEIEELKAQMAELKNQLAHAEKDVKDSNGFTAKQAAIFITAICHNLGGLPQNGRQSLSSLMQSIWGFSESTARKKLGGRIEQNDAEALASLFTDISPKITKIIMQLPEELDNKENTRLSNLAKKNK